MFYLKKSPKPLIWYSKQLSPIAYFVAIRILYECASHNDNHHHLVALMWELCIHTGDNVANNDTIERHDTRHGNNATTLYNKYNHDEDDAGTYLSFHLRV